MKEEWRDIKGYEGLYQVSNLGRVKSLKRKVRNGNSSSRVCSEVIRKPSKTNSGYLQIFLYKNGLGKTYYIHYLVANTFLGYERKDKSIVIDHIDNSRVNNRSDNLQLITNRENISKAFKSKKTSSKYVGVNRLGNQWQARIMLNKKRIGLGVFDTEKEAHFFYQNALKCIIEGRVNEIKIKKQETRNKYKGVYCRNGRNKWESYLRINKKQTYIGAFKTEYEAHLAYQAKLKEISS